MNRSGHVLIESLLIIALSIILLGSFWSYGSMAVARIWLEYMGQQYSVCRLKTQSEFCQKKYKHYVNWLSWGDIKHFKHRLVIDQRSLLSSYTEILWCNKKGTERCPSHQILKITSQAEEKILVALPR